MFSGILINLTTLEAESFDAFTVRPAGVAGAARRLHHAWPTPK
ncbi:hypothetical protein [Streptomyces sp. NPDC056387]